MALPMNGTELALMRRIEKLEHDLGEALERIRVLESHVRLEMEERQRLLDDGK